ncbi:hypothetical protein EHO58_17945 [Leptospira selangorensis]|uniref:hypothetical protein n=1 Tax=Leptospira selangorensis TaxID=2484982 RepID=UPI001083E035|nr:hypothetical protein [Leptospira selangorensis]TGK01631.1 hypothetical protein EHO58_17945 [Leptospira selangorensis]
MFETEISFLHLTLGNVKIDFLNTSINTISDVNILRLKLQFQVNNPLPVVCHGFEVTLKINGISEVDKFSKLHTFDFSLKYTSNFDCNFKIPNSIFEKIESNRKDDVNFSIDFVFHANKKRKIVGIDNQTFEVIEATQNLLTANLHFNIPKSFWIEKILNNSTLQKIALVEIPISSFSDLEYFTQAINELNEANKYYLLGDYDKSVGHCRSLLESLQKEKDKLLKYSDSDSNKKAFIDANALTFDWLDKTSKTIKSITNKPHHSPSVGHFGREEGYSILLIVMALIKFWSSQIRTYNDIQT